MNPKNPPYDNHEEHVIFLFLSGRAEMSEEDQEKIIKKGYTSPDEFVRDFMVAEGYDPDLDLEIYRNLKRSFITHCKQYF